MSAPAPPRGPPPAGLQGAGALPPGFRPGGTFPRGPMGLSVRGLPPGLPPRGMPPRGAPPSGPPRGGAAALAGAKFGTLTITVVAGKDLTPLDGPSSATMDSLVVVRVGVTEKHTPVCTGGGTRPKFDATIPFEIRAEREVDVSVFYRRGATAAGFDDVCVARGRANFMPWIAQGNFMGDVPLKDDAGQPAGTLRLSAKFERAPPAAAAAPGAPLPTTLATSSGAAPATIIPSVGPKDPNTRFTDKEVRDAFVSFDLDSNDFVGAAELRHVLVNIGENVTDEEVDEMIKMCDTDGDGQVSYDEFYRMVTGRNRSKEDMEAGAGAGAGAGKSGASSAPAAAQRNARKLAMQNFVADNHFSPELVNRAKASLKKKDTDNSGVVDHSDFCEILGVDPSPATQKLFKMFDTENTGQIRMKEFLITLFNFSPSQKEDKLNFAFNMYANQEQIITKAELMRVLMSNHMALNEKEVVKKAETVLAQCGDTEGVVSYDDYMKVAKRFPNILFSSALYGNAAK